MNTRHEHDSHSHPTSSPETPPRRLLTSVLGEPLLPLAASALFAFRCGQAVAAGPTFPSYASSAAVSPRDWPEPWPRHLDTKPRHQLDTSTPHANSTNSTPLDTPRHPSTPSRLVPCSTVSRCQTRHLDTPRHPSTPLDTPRHRSTPLDTARHL